MITNFSKLIYPFALLFLHQPVFGVEGDGTPERTEFEYKLAYIPSARFQISDFIKKVDQSLKSKQFMNALSFARSFGSRYELQNDLKAFVFKDIYFDTDSLEVLGADSSYRLRYRWSKLSDYARHQLFSFKKAFYPTRCEIQFKRDYNIDEQSGAVSVHESRFEFRNDSEPFVLEENAPASPWPEEEYKLYTKNGSFKAYKMLPSQILKDTLKQSTPKLSPVVTVETVRYRTHLVVPNNPWGTGPNPDQVFILTVDLSSWKYADGTRSTKPILEIEIETDRNTSLMIGHGKELLETTLINRLAKKSSTKAFHHLSHDQKKLKLLLQEMIKTHHIGQKLKTNYKYARIMNRRGKS